MAKKREYKVPPELVRVVLVLLLACLVGLWIVNRTQKFFLKSDYFRIKSISVDPTLHFILNNPELTRLKGKSIFAVNLKEVQRRIQKQYPEVAELKVEKRLPDMIIVDAKKRRPIAQTKLKNKVLIVDEKGVVLFISNQFDSRFPIIYLTKGGVETFTLGLPLDRKDLLMAVKILKIYYSYKPLIKYKISQINVESLSDMHLYLTSSIEVIVDWDKMYEKFKILADLLTSGSIDLREVKYIDLRFKEPTIGKKDIKNETKFKIPK